MPEPGTMLALIADGLYGDDHQLPHLVHCEPISARSRLHGWELQAHRHPRLHQVLVLARAEGSAVVDGSRHQLVDLHALNVPAGAIHSFSFRPWTDGWVVTMAVELFDDVLRHDRPLRALLARPALVPVNAEVLRLASQLAAEHDLAPRPATSPLVLRSLTGLLLGLLGRSFHRGSEAAGTGTGQPAVAPVVATRFARFLDLLEEHVADRWSVARYAEAVGVSPTHLSRLTNAAVDKPASRLIDDRVILEARRNLAYTDLPIATISADLGFTDPAYFTRVFRRVVGCSPRSFRRQVTGLSTGSGPGVGPPATP